MERVLAVLTHDRVMAEVERRGIFTLGYRIMKEGRPYHIQLRAALVEEKEGRRLVVGLNDIDVQVRQEEEMERRIAQAQTKASVDALTGVKNMHAYQDVETRMNRLIEARRQAPFALVVLDVNDLKKVNDTLGHKAGDQYLRDACKAICTVFAHSPVFRVGGDEFAVISQGSDYEDIEELLVRMAHYNARAVGTTAPVVACDMSRFDDDASVAAVFERADQRMYENKARLKAIGG
jgi:diguanylate cyclase (GGDEF)-like protein